MKLTRIPDAEYQELEPVLDQYCPYSGYLVAAAWHLKLTLMCRQWLVCAFSRHRANMVSAAMAWRLAKSHFACMAVLTSWWGPRSF